MSALTHSDPVIAMLAWSACFLKSNRYATKQQKAMLKLFLDYAALNSNPVTSMQVKDIKNEESVDSENSGDNVDSVESGESGENRGSGESG